MGDRTYVDLDCVFCGERNEDVWFAPTCGFDNQMFECEECGEMNFVTADFKAKKPEEVKINDFVDSFKRATNVARTEEEILEICKGEFREFRKNIVKVEEEK